MKTCNHCGVVKEYIDFHKNRAQSDGLHGRCKQCRKEKETGLYYLKNKGKIKDKVREYNWNKRFPYKHAAYQTKRRARKLKATPEWLTPEQNAHIKRTYKLREIISDETGVVYHVDHIVPLQGKDVCGLHVPWNLRVIPGTVNCSKHNKFNEGGLLMATHGG